MSTVTTPAPQRYSGRIAGLDIARGLAIIGMLTAHVTALSDRDGVSGFLQMVSQGRSSILFATLAGVSIAILTGRNQPYSGIPMLQARLRVFARAAMLIVITGVLALMNDMIALILAFYAAWFVIALPFTRWKPRSLFIAAAVTALAGPIVHQFLGTLLSRLSMGPGGDANHYFVEVMVSGTYTGLVFMAFIFAGMGIGRLRIDRTRVQALLLAVGAAISAFGYLGGYLSSEWAASADSVTNPSKSIAPDVEPALPGGFGDGTWENVPGSMWGKQPSDLEGFTSSTSGYIGSGSGDVMGGDGLGPEWDTTYQWPGLTQFAGAEPHTGTIFEAFGSGGLAIAIIGFLLLTGRWLRVPLYPLAAVGAMSLTTYSAHIIVLWFKPEWVGTSDSHPLWILAGSLLLGATLWRLLFRRGPLEWVMWAVSHKAASIPAETPNAEAWPAPWAAPPTGPQATGDAGTGPVTPTSPVSIPDARMTSSHR